MKTYRQSDWLTDCSNLTLDDATMGDPWPIACAALADDATMIGLATTHCAPHAVEGILPTNGAGRAAAAPD